MTIGWFGEDLWDGAKDVASSAVDAVGGAIDAAWDVLDDVPGFQQLGEGTKALFKGPLRDFANTAVGQVVLRAMTSMVMGGIGAALGPALASWPMMAAASLPGVLRGESFDEAILSENLWRLEKTAKILGADVGQLASDQFGEAARELTRRAAEAFPDLDVPEAVKQLAAASGVDLETYARRLAKDLGIREDMALEALELAARVKLLTHEAYDYATGKKIGAGDPYAPVYTVRLADSASMLSNARKLVALARPVARVPVSTSVSVLNRSPAFLALRSSGALDRAPAPAPAPLERAPAPPPAEKKSSALPVALVLVAGVAGAWAVWKYA